MKQKALSLEGVSKSYQRGKVSSPDLRTSIPSWWKSSKKQKEFFNALEDINLQIEQGDIVGIVGPNGAGKSTLLKLLSRITFPTTGRITIQGS
ncbi:MAG TPA: ATP-binding cassette domain-containing protein, partial [Saprospiraceae bacterium]|nr:ATP-binding cassette domain-containing protein [Saprospiraceae bacterium]